MRSYEIELPITKPETEWVRGRALVKRSPTRNHARVQLLLANALHDWSAGRGEVGTEWRFRVAPPGEPRRPLVPDIAFVTNSALAPYSDDEIQIPALAPTIAVEVLSPGDRNDDVLDKIDVYLRAGTRLVVIADPATRTIVTHDVAGVCSFDTGDVFTHPALPDFALEVGPFLLARSTASRLEANRR